MPDKLPDAELDEQVARMLYGIPEDARLYPGYNHPHFMHEGEPVYIGSWSTSLDAAMELWEGRMVAMKVFARLGLLCMANCDPVILHAPTPAKAARLLTEKWVEMRKGEKERE